VTPVDREVPQAATAEAEQALPGLLQLVGVATAQLVDVIDGILGDALTPVLREAAQLSRAHDGPVAAHLLRGLADHILQADHLVAGLLDVRAPELEVLLGLLQRLLELAALEQAL